MWRKSITVRLALYFGSASTAVLLAIGYLVGMAVEQHFLELDRADLSQDSRTPGPTGGGPSPALEVYGCVGETYRVWGLGSAVGGLGVGGLGRLKLFRRSFCTCTHINLSIYIYMQTYTYTYIYLYIYQHSISIPVPMPINIPKSVTILIPTRIPCRI